MRGFAAGLMASVGLGAVLGLGVGSATAAELPTPGMAESQIALRFERLDEDGDHMLSAREARPYASLTAVFAEFDIDGDDALSLAEFSGTSTQTRVLSEVFTF